jgi:cell division transport system ATP-binding protein
MQNAIVTLDNATIINENNVIFSSINFKVNAGEFIFLIGKTGAGKSSLLKVLYGDLTLESGKGSIVGFDITELKDKQIPLLRRKIGVVFQDFKLLPDRTIFENLSFVLKATGWKEKSKIKARVIEVLNLVNISPETQKYPFELSGA